MERQKCIYFSPFQHATMTKKKFLLINTGNAIESFDIMWYPLNLTSSIHVMYSCVKNGHDQYGRYAQSPVFIPRSRRLLFAQLFQMVERHNPTVLFIPFPFKATVTSYSRLAFR